MKPNLSHKPFFVLTMPLIFIACSVFGQHEKFRKANNKVYVVAHRGVHQGIPENSLPAYQKAIDLGCDFVEIDVRTTKDGKFVSIHNSTIDNYVEGKTGFVRNMTLSELKKLDIGARHGEEWKNTQIPTFEEILQLCSGKIGIYLDLKDATVPELMELIRKYQMGKDVVWYVPYRYFMETEDVVELFGNSFPMPDPQNKNNLKLLFEKHKIAVIATDMGELSESFVIEAHKNEAKVFVDEKRGTEKEWEQILMWKTDGIQTDNPEELIKFLTKQNYKLK